MLTAAIAESNVGDDNHGSVRLWRVSTDAPEPVGPSLSVDPATQARGHTDDWLTALCAVPDVNGRTSLAAGGRDRAVLLWEPAKRPPEA